MERDVSLMVMKVSALSVIPTTVLAIYRYKTSNQTQKYLCYLVFISFFVECAAEFFLSVLKTNNLPLLHIFTLFEFGFIALIFKDKVKPYFSEINIYWLIAIFSIFSIYNSIFHESIFMFNAFARAVMALLIILLALVYFYTTLKSMKEKQLERSPIFWISSGVLLYFSSSLFIFIYSNVLFGETKNSFTIWGLHAIMSIILNIFYVIALWVKPKQQGYQVY